MPPQAVHKQSGSRDYYKVTDDNDSELNRIANKVREPVQEEDGNNPRHVDVPTRKIGWIATLLGGVTLLFSILCLAQAIIERW